MKMHRFMLAVITACTMFLSSLYAQILPEDQIPLDIQEGFFAQVIAEHGYLNMSELEMMFRDWLLSIPLPAADGLMLDSGSCGICQPPTDAEDLLFNPVRDVRIISAADGRIRSGFKVKWRRPERLPSNLRDQYELDRYEVYLTRDDGIYEHHIIEKVLRADGSIKLPRRIRFRNRTPGDYQVSVRPVYVPIDQAGILSSSDNHAVQGDSPSFNKLGSGLSSEGASKGSWEGSNRADLSPTDSLDTIFNVDNGNSNQQLYDCLIQTMGQSGSTTADQILTIDCADSGISEISELQYFSSLRTLILHNIDDNISNDNELCDISFIQELASLEHLNLNPTLSHLIHQTKLFRSIWIKHDHFRRVSLQ